MLLAASLFFITLPLPLRAAIFEPDFPQRLAILLRTAPGKQIPLVEAPESDAWVETIRTQPDGSPARVQYVEFLKERWGYNIERLSQAYSISASSFTDLFSIDWRALDRKRAAVASDDSAFAVLLRRELNRALRDSGVKVLLRCGDPKLACTPSGKAEGEIREGQLLLKPPER